MLSATTQESRDSMAAKIAIVKASGRTFCTVVRENVGSEIDGSLLEISYRSPIVLTSRCRPATAALPAITAIREAGIRFKKPGSIGQKIRMARLRMPTISACTFSVPIKTKTAFNLSIVSISGSSVTILRPRKSLI